MISRWSEHSMGQGSKWTSTYKPIRINSVERVPAKYVTGRELQLTAEKMMQHGINRVRGACFCKVHPFATENIVYARMIIAHILGLNYDEVESTLLEQLKHQPSLPTPLVQAKKLPLKLSPSIPKLKSACARCGRANHAEAECYAKFHKNGTAFDPFVSDVRCFRCGKRGHESEDCFSKTRVGGGDVIAEEMEKTTIAKKD